MIRWFTRMTVKEIFETMNYGPAPEGAELALDWIARHQNEFGIFVDGEWIKTESRFDVFAPRDGSVLAKVGQSSSDDVNLAVVAARKAYENWSKLKGFERAIYLYAIARQIQKHSRLFAVLESLDNGKPIRETRDIDIPLVARHFYHHAGWAQIADSEFPEYESVGVCGQIIPWNFPLLMMAWKIAPAIAMGNTVVLKPAEFTSLTALLFAEICASVGLPKGVVNIVTGDGETGKAIVEHKDIDKIAFTGSTEVGRILRTVTAGTGKKLSLELGGKSPFVVFEDADIDSAIEGLVDAIWFNQGQVCCAGSRLLVQEGIADKVTKKLKARMGNLRVGDPLDKAVDIGAIIDSTQLQRIDELVQLGKSEGAELYQPTCKMPESGWFYPPTLLSNVTPSSTVAQVEIFGPVLVMMTFRTPQEAVDLANNTVYGLAASVWTDNVNLALDVAAQIKAGSIWVNCTNQFDAASGFGGFKESGFGREGGREGLFEYLKPKDFWISAPKQEMVTAASSGQNEAFDRTHKMYIAGKQMRGDGGYSTILTDAVNGDAYEVSLGNRKDIRNAVEAAVSKAKSWMDTTAHGRAQILFYLAENLSSEKEKFVRSIMASGVTKIAAENEFEASVERIMLYAGWCDKYDGTVHGTPFRGMTYARNEAIGAVGVICPDESGLLGWVSLVMPLVAMGNTVVSVPSENAPLPVLEMYRVIDASDMPAGVINIVTGNHSELEKTLSDHDALAALWHFGTKDGSADAEKRSSANLKQTWSCLGKSVDWHASPSKEFLRRATQVKNIWVPYGE